MLTILYTNSNQTIRVSNFYPDENGHYNLTFTEKHFIFGALLNGKRVVTTKFNPIEQYFCLTHQQPFKIEINDFSLPPRAFILKSNDLKKVDCCCKDEKITILNNKIDAKLILSEYEDYRFRNFSLNTDSDIEFYAVITPKKLDNLQLYLDNGTISEQQIIINQPFTFEVKKNISNTLTVYTSAENWIGYVQVDLYENLNNNLIDSINVDFVNTVTRDQSIDGNTQLRRS